MKSAETAVENNNRGGVRRFQYINLSQQRINLTYNNEVNLIRELLRDPNFNAISPSWRSEGITPAELAEIQAYRIFLQQSNQTYASHNVAYQNFKNSQSYQRNRFNDPILWNNLTANNFRGGNTLAFHGTWDNIRQEIKPPHSRHTLSGVKKGLASEKNTLINNRLVNVSQDIRDIQNGLGKPISHTRIEINGRVYERHTGNGKDANRLYPISSTNPNEFFSINRGTYASLKMILQQNGNYNMARKYAMNSSKCNSNDFNEAIRIYNMLK